MLEEYWESRWKQDQTGWDTGSITPPLRNYIDQLENKELNILVPGAGNGYEVEYLFNQGFKNSFMLEIAASAIKSFRQRVPKFPEDHLIEDNFFAHQGAYDLIVEQTFFCAIDPSLRTDYVKKSADLLLPGGKIVGLLWGIPLAGDQPPFGGSREEYERLFSEKFHLKTMSVAHTSILPRAQKELFINFIKK